MVPDQQLIDYGKAEGLQELYGSVLADNNTICACAGNSALPLGLSPAKNACGALY
jgi:hypothetical protein